MAKSINSVDNQRIIGVKHKIHKVKAKVPTLGNYFSNNKAKGDESVGYDGVKLSPGERQERMQLFKPVQNQTVIVKTSTTIENCGEDEYAQLYPFINKANEINLQQANKIAQSGFLAYFQQYNDLYSGHYMFAIDEKSGDTNSENTEGAKIDEPCEKQGEKLSLKGYQIQNGGKVYNKINDTVKDGNCALNMLANILKTPATEKSFIIMRYQMLPIIEAHFVLNFARLKYSAFEQLSDNDVKELTVCFARVFAKNIGLFQAYFTEIIDETLGIEGLHVETKNSLISLKTNLGNVSNFNLDGELCYRLLKQDLGVSTQNMLLNAHIHSNKSLINEMNAYRVYLTTDKNWLDREVIIAYLLSKGLRLVSSNIDSDSTVLTFKSLTNGAVHYLYNNANFHEQDIFYGTHWCYLNLAVDNCHIDV